MRVYFGLAIAVVLGLVGVSRAKPLDLEQVAADAKWVAHLDADAMRASTVADKVYEHWRQKSPGAERQLAIIRTAWNFNPVMDIFGVTLYGNKIEEDTGVVILHAKVDQRLLLDKVRKAPRHREGTYGQHQLHTWWHREGKKHGHNMTGVFYSPDVIVVGCSIDEVKAALDVLDGTKPNLAGKKSPLATPVPGGTMILARVVGLKDAQNLAVECPFVKQTESLSLVIGEQEGNTFFFGRMSVSKPELAKQMRTFVESGRVMAAMVHSDDVDALELIDALRVSADGKVVRVEWQAPAEKVWSHIQKYDEDDDDDD